MGSDLRLVPKWGQEFSICHVSRRYSRACIRHLVRQAIFMRFAAQMVEPKPRRKGMVGFTGIVDTVATLRYYGVKRSPIDGLTKDLFRQMLVTYLSGAMSFGDRRQAAGMAQTDVCETCGVRATTFHCLHECPKHAGTRAKYERWWKHLERRAIRADDETHGESFGQLQRMRSNVAFMCTGMTILLLASKLETVRMMTLSQFGRSTREREIIKFKDSSVVKVISGRRYLKVYTDGSIHSNRYRWLSFGGWGLFCTRR